MTRLEARRKQLEEDKLHGPLLRLDELSTEELDVINTTFWELCRRRRVANIQETYTAYVDTLHHWKVMCPHPQPQRLYDGNRRSDVPLDFETHRWYDCQLCGTSVINR